MIARVESCTDYMAINTHKISSILVDYTLDPSTRFVRSVTVTFDVSNHKDNAVVFPMDVEADTYKIYKIGEIWCLKKYIIDFITESLYKHLSFIDVDNALSHALNQILIDRERD